MWYTVCMKQLILAVLVAIALSGCGDNGNGPERVEVDWYIIDRGDYVEVIAMKWLLLVTLLFSLTSCGDDFFDGGGPTDVAGSGSGHATYEGIIETLAVEGYMQEMTQKPEPPAPPSDQKGCPEVAVVLILLGGLYGWKRTQKVFGLSQNQTTV